jgi:hypothetical protein
MPVKSRSTAAAPAEEQSPTGAEEQQTAPGFLERSTKEILDAGKKIVKRTGMTKERTLTRGLDHAKMVTS